MLQAVDLSCLLKNDSAPSQTLFEGMAMNTSESQPKWRQLDETGKWVGTLDPPIQFFAERILVRCGRCRKCAVVRSDKYDEQKKIFVTESSCSYCGEIWTIQKKRLRDSYLELPLLLQTRCCNEVLWASNEEHLRYLEMYLGAQIQTGYFSWPFLAPHARSPRRL